MTRNKILTLGLLAGLLGVAGSLRASTAPAPASGPAPRQPHQTDQASREAASDPWAVRALLVGAKAPAVELSNSSGGTVDLGATWKSGGHVVVFFRGDW